MTGQAPIWQGLTPEEHEAQYNPQRSVPNFADFQAQRATFTAEAIKKLKREVDIAYGPDPLHKVDIYPGAGSGPRPVHIFFHGGYWRAQDKANFAFIGNELVPRGITTVVANYALCPAATLDGTVDSAIACLAWTARHIGEFGGDASRITLSGHSAGAHLTAACLAADARRLGLEANPVKGAVLISGIYDPAPAMRAAVNAEIGLTAELCARHNYEERPPAVRCPVWVIAGAEEPWHWIDQSFRYAHHLHRQGVRPGVIVCPGNHHFNIINQYLDARSHVLRAILSLPR